jgi:hypothetical protein
VHHGVRYEHGLWELLREPTERYGQLWRVWRELLPASNASPVCQQGNCDFQCTGSRVRCGNQCVDTKTDAANCGQCGNACTSGSGATATCSNSTCSVACNGGLSTCGGACVDTQTNDAHCGKCDKPCGNKKKCVNGRCEK